MEAPVITYDEVFTLLTPAYERALKSGALNYYESGLHTHNEAGIDFEIRLCPALLVKPAGQPLQFDNLKNIPVETRKSRDPFERPYPEPDLHVGDLKEEGGQSSYAILLNKFCVVANHFILTTIAFETQTTPLLPSDLLHVYRILQASRRTNQHFFAFYNCGEQSGASQPHKHVQFLPLSDGRGGNESGPPVEILAKSQSLETESRPFSIASLPYAHYIQRLPRSLQSASTSDSDLKDTLTQVFINLLDLAITTLRHDDNNKDDEENETPNHASGGPPSYNVIMTLEHIHIIPRLREKFTFRTSPTTAAPSNQQPLDETIAEIKGEKLSVNSLGFAGMLLVKSEKELKEVKGVGVVNILKGVAAGKVEIEESLNDREFPF